MLKLLMAVLLYAEMRSKESALDQTANTIINQQHQVQHQHQRRRQQQQQQEHETR